MTPDTVAGLNDALPIEEALVIMRKNLVVIDKCFETQKSCAESTKPTYYRINGNAVTSHAIKTPHPLSTYKIEDVFDDYVFMSNKTHANEFLLFRLNDERSVLRDQGL